MRTYHVGGMSCGGCASAVKKSILKIDENAEVEVDLDEALVKVESDLDEGQIREAVEGAGFDFEGNPQ